MDDEKRREEEVGNMANGKWRAQPGRCR